MADGTVCSDCQPLLTALNDERMGLQETIRRQAGAIGKLRREDPQKKLREHEQWNRVHTFFKKWQRATGHTRSRFTADRFVVALSFFDDYEDEMIERGISGIAFDPYVTRRKNGTEQRHDGWELLFRDAGKFEEFCNRAPLGKTETLADDAREVEARV